MMRLHILTFMVLCAVLLASIPAAASAETIGGDQGWYVVHCNVDGAAVYFGNDYKGDISGGELSVAVYTTGTPYTSFHVEKEGYDTYYGDVYTVPAKGETIDLYATLNAAGPTVGPIGGDQGWFKVHCNVDGAQVYFDNDEKGVISGGELNVGVYTTATPYKTVKVEMAGYQTSTQNITNYPGKGETVDIYATLNPVSPPTTASAPSPLFGLLAAGIALGAIALMVRRD
jgi:hypothetical protein